MQKLTGKIGFLAKAVEDADLKGVKEFASDMKKLGMPVEHAPQVSRLQIIITDLLLEQALFLLCNTFLFFIAMCHLNICF